MSSWTVNILFGVAGSLMAIIYLLLFFAYRLVCKESKEDISANRGDVESCIESKKNTKENIIQAKPVTDVSRTLPYCEECSIYVDSGTLPPCYCDTNKGP